MPVTSWRPTPAASPRCSSATSTTRCARAPPPPRSRASSLASCRSSPAAWSATATGWSAAGSRESRPLRADEPEQPLVERQGNAPADHESVPDVGVDDDVEGAGHGRGGHDGARPSFAAQPRSHASPDLVVVRTDQVGGGDAVALEVPRYAEVDERR